MHAMAGADLVLRDLPAHRLMGGAFRSEVRAYVVEHVPVHRGGERGAPGPVG